MTASFTDFEPKASDWLKLNLRYEGPGVVDFTSPIGSAQGRFVATFEDRGEQRIEATCDLISCDPDYEGPPIAFFSGAKVEKEEGKKSWGFGGLNNRPKSLTISTPDGTFSADRLHFMGMTTQLVVAKVEDLKPTMIRFRVLQGKFETKNTNSPKYFVIPLLNCVAEPTNFLSGAHPLRIYQTPTVPESLQGRERWIAEAIANKKNLVVAFKYQDGLCFIERLADFSGRLDALQNGAQRLATAVLVGEIGSEPVTTWDEFRSWFPMEVLSALGFASGVEVGFSWIEIRDEQGGLIRRLHGASWQPVFDEGDVVLGKFAADTESGMGTFLTRYIASSSEKRSFLEPVFNHARLGSLGISLRLYDNLDHLIRAFECLCRENKLTQRQLLPSLSLDTQNKVKAIQATARAALQALIGSASQVGQFEDARVLETIRSRVENIASTENNLGLAIVDLLKEFQLPDANIIDSYFGTNPRSDQIPDWASVISAYRNATIHEGYMDFETKHNVGDVIRVCRHLKDVLCRIILKEVVYVGEYDSVLAYNYGPQPIDWIEARTEPRRLGFE